MYCAALIDIERRIAKFTVRGLIQVVTIITFGLGMLAVIWMQHSSAVGAGTATADYLNSPMIQDRWSNCNLTDFRRMSIGPPRADLPAIGDPERLRAILPAGTQFDIMIQGGVTAQRDDRAWGRKAWPYLVYVFEVSYRRTIESNDGHRIVERRNYNFARMAKLLTTVDDLELQFEPGQSTILSGIDFPGPDSSVHVGNTAEVATRVLRTFDSAIATPESSLCLLQRNPLHGKTVRMTFVDGVGVESVETLGAPLKRETFRYLFGQRVLPLGIGRDLHHSSDQHAVLDGQECMRFCDPAKPVLPGIDVRIDTDIHRGGSTRNAFVLRRLISQPSNAASIASHADQRGTRDNALGSVRFDASGTFVKEAKIRWRYPELEAPEGHVLFEHPYRDLRGTPTFLVHYNCRKVRHVAARTR